VDLKESSCKAVERPFLRRFFEREIMSKGPEENHVTAVQLSCGHTVAAVCLHPTINTLFCSQCVKDVAIRIGKK
jgi:hypothetical protein